MKRHQGLLTAVAGFSLGTTLASAYLVLGGAYFFSVPLWARIAFCPGFFVGQAVYDLGLSRNLAKTAGLIAVGLAYAALAVLVRFGWVALKLHRQSAALPHGREGATGRNREQPMIPSIRRKV
jgi:hypothetical protein